jgi:hypothetical protein
VWPCGGPTPSFWATIAEEAVHSRGVRDGPGRVRTCDLGIKSLARTSADTCNELKLPAMHNRSLLHLDVANCTSRRQAGTPIRSPYVVICDYGPDTAAHVQAPRLPLVPHTAGRPDAAQFPRSGGGHKRPPPRAIISQLLVADQMSVFPNVAGQSSSGHGAGKASSPAASEAAR